MTLLINTNLFKLDFCCDFFILSEGYIALFDLLAAKMVLIEITNVMQPSKAEAPEDGSCAPQSTRQITPNVVQTEAVEDGSCAPPNTPKLQLVRQITPKPFVRPLTWAPVKKPPPHDYRPIPENSTAKRAIKFD